MSEVTLNGVIIQFPFKPYQVQEDYMKKVIECLQDGKNGVLESPTGTGKTLSLLCSSLAWLMIKKAQIQIEVQSMGALDQVSSGNHFVDQFTKSIDRGGGKALVQAQNSFNWSMPKVIYALRTHSQLTQAIQELKRTSYKHVNVAVLGSRDQLCLHPEVAREPNSVNKIHMCQSKIKDKSCFYYNNVERRKDDEAITRNIMDIEDLVKTGQKLKCCPYYLSRELKQNADIIFMPYNYLLDPRTRKKQGVELQNNVVLLDEAHNVEKMCEEAASLQISSTDVAVCIDEITAVMKDMANETNEPTDFSFESANAPQKDFSTEDLCILKAMFLELEKAIDSIEICKADDGETFPGGYIFELLAKADITQGKEHFVIEKLDKIILYLSTVSTSSFNRKGNALQKFSDLLRVVFTGSSTNRFRERIKECYKVYIQFEPAKKSFKNDAWETKKITKPNGKLINYWCFSPGFGMQHLLDQGVRSIILTSGTLSPLKPFISEIGINIEVQLENPHIVSNKQICVGIVSTGYDGYILNSSYNTRNDPKYIASLGETIKILSCVLPHGLLIFFPSYPIMKKCQEEWQKSGKWTQIETNKAIYVEPQSKETFNNVMSEYYKKIRDPTQRGAIFMAVCRGKVSEGLDFANANGRAVLITGLPFPPLMDPKIKLKQKYLDENKASGKESLSGQQWYQLECSRAVNQAIGRIIRHKDDYGAILLCDCRFDNPSFKQHFSAWIRPHIKKFQDFRMVIKDLREFFMYAKANFPQPLTDNTSNDMLLPAVPAQFDTCGSHMRKITSKESSVKTEKRNENFDINIYKSEKKIEEVNSNPKNFASLLEAKEKPIVNFTTCKLQTTSTIFQEPATTGEPSAKRRKLKIKPMNFRVDEPTIPSTSKTMSSKPSQSLQSSQSSQPKPTQTDESARAEQGKKYIKEIKRSLSQSDFHTFKNMVANYQKNLDSFDELLLFLKKLFITEHKKVQLFIDFRTFIKKDQHMKVFDDYVQSMDVSSIR